MNSMTGFGAGECGGITVEIKSVNNRFLDVNLRAFKGINSLDISIRKLISQNVKRGNLDVYITINQAQCSPTPSADYNLINAYLSLAKKIEGEMQIPNDLSFKLLTKIGAIRAESGEIDQDLLAQNTMQAADLAVKALNAMRKTEGESIKADLEALINQLSVSVNQIGDLAKDLPQKLNEKLMQRLDELLNGVAIDQSKIAAESAILADKADINEELSRLASHISQFNSELNSNEPQGRKLEFLSQELNREINTIGSKSADISISCIVVELKTILEKLKEQIRNIE